MSLEGLEASAMTTPLPTGTNRLLFEEEYPGITPAELFRYWTEPALLVSWWPQQAEVEPRAGGEYHLAWPGMDWHLRGRYLSFEPVERLSFTWHWDHEADVPMRYVDLYFEPLEGRGTMLSLMHSEYGGGDQAERQGHIEGWVHFLGKLQDVIRDRS